MRFLIWYRALEPDLAPNEAMERPWTMLARSHSVDMGSYLWEADDADMAILALDGADPREGEYVLIEVSRPLFDERFDVKPSPGDVHVYKRTVRHPPRPDKYIENEDGERVDVQTARLLDASSAD